MRFLGILFLSIGAASAVAGPVMQAGDLALRHDIQSLADHGVIAGPVTSWPLAWAPILDDMQNADVENLPAAVLGALLRVKRRADWETEAGQFRIDTKIGFADNATRIRSFHDSPRGAADISAGASWIGRHVSFDLNAQYVDSRQDSAEFRVDNSMIGVAIGNWTVAASTMQRWWGPGWDGSLVLSNNARPIPALTVDRLFTDPFENRWLHWIGPWDLSVMFGQLERQREVPDAQFFGMRFSFRPLPSLEIGLTRTAQWCGEGRSCNLSTFGNLLLGRDNRGDTGIGVENEPGNQLAGIDFRWRRLFGANSVSIYGQFIGEDEAGGLPSRFLGQGGFEFSGYFRDRWTYRTFAEFAGTTCQFHESSELFNCAYNHGVYKTGYRYRGRTIGHPADNDARMFSIGLVMLDDDDQQWRALLRYGKLNRGGAPDERNTLTATAQDVVSIDVSHSRVFWFGVVDLGIGHEKIEAVQTGNTESEGRLYLQWRSSY